MADVLSSSEAGADKAPRRDADWLAPKEFALLESICEAFFPSLEPPPGSSEDLATFYRLKASDVSLAPLVSDALSKEEADKRAEVHLLFTLMNSPILGMLLIGSLRRFVDLSPAQREQYLLALANSPIGKFREGYQALKRLCCFYFFATPVADGKNPTWKSMGYEVPAPPPATATRPIKPLTITENTRLECDVVVIGSGAGGGLVAGELAMAGKSVIVLEKGGYVSDTDFTLQESEAMNNLYLHRGTLTSKDKGVTILAGSTLGGGTVVNWCTSFRTPNDVLSQWEEISGLKDFTGSALQESFAAVEQRIHVNLDNSAHNRQNQLLFDGSKALGYHAGVLRRNAEGCEQRCGTCLFGCRYGCKQSTMKTYLQDAYDHGARIIVHCSADKVLLENGKKAVGVRALAYNPETGATHEVIVRAKGVVVAAGSIHSPAVLLRSGLDNRHIGRHLFLHPVAVATGLYPEPVNPWHGVMQSAYSNEFASLDGNYGYKLEVPPMHPGLMGAAFPWYGARSFRNYASEGAYMASFIVLARDKGEGYIALDRGGEPEIRYVTSVFDRRHLLHGLRRAARIHFAAGATRVMSLHVKPTLIEQQGDSSVNERQWRQFDLQLERHGMGPNRLMIFSAHQMGTCRMGADPRLSVVDGTSQVHGVEGLFVCDGSVFPAPSGTNPMLSIMGLAHRSAQYIKKTV